MNQRHQILDDNRKMREGVIGAPTRLEEGEVVFRIPQEDWPALVKARPELQSKDHVIRLKAWWALRNSPEGEKYLVQRPPRKVRANDHRIIVR